MIKGDYDQLVDLAKRNVCAEHGTPLEVAWYSAEKCRVLRCGHGHYPDAITAQWSLTQAWKRGEEIPEPIKSNIEKSQRRRSMQEDNRPLPVAIGGIPGHDLGTGEALGKNVVQALLRYAQKYQLDAFRSHVCLMYGKPYITLDGYLYHANKSGIAYSLYSRPMTTEEIAQYKVGETDYGWLTEVNFTDTGAKFTGTGIVTYEEMTATSEKRPGQLKSPVVARFPWQLAQKRAEWQALRRAFPIGVETEK
jgi:hypothetical protein